jgi:hypothetical protein
MKRVSCQTWRIPWLAHGSVTGSEINSSLAWNLRFAAGLE